MTCLGACEKQSGDGYGTVEICRLSQCKECGGSGICKHGRQRGQCKECSPNYRHKPPKRKRDA